MLQTFSDDWNIQFSSYSGMRTLVCGPKIILSGATDYTLPYKPAVWCRLGLNSAVTIGYDGGLPFLSHAGAASYFRIGNDASFAHTSKYVDVYGADGVLNWSAGTSKLIPMVKGSISFSKSEIMNDTSAVAIPENHYVMMSNILMMAGYSGVGVQSFGIILKRRVTGEYQIYSTWSGPAFQEFLQNGLPPMLYIPYAEIKD